MRRIDLFCKLLGPLLISLIDGFATKIAIFVTFGLSVVSVGIEYLAIAQVISYSGEQTFLLIMRNVFRSIRAYLLFVTLTAQGREDV